MSAAVHIAEARTSPISVRGRRVPRALVVALTLTAALMFVGSPAADADAWGGIRHCWPTEESCYVRSLATGNVVHERCTTAFTNCEVKGSWSNGTGDPIWRSSWHGGGSQGVFIFTTGTLSSQSATCVCVVQNCPS